MNKKYLPPILIIGYNRLNKINNLINIIKKVEKVKTLYFKIDGPKNKFDEIQIWKIKNLLSEFKKKSKIKINIKIEKKNIGLKKNIISGVNWSFKKEKKLIILEDDNIPSISFFYFCKKMLNIYENNTKIMHISGTSFLKNKQQDDYFFSKLADCVGWATWKSSWEKMVGGFNLNKVLDNKKFSNYFNSKEEKIWFSEYLFREINTEQRKCLWTTWWQLSIIKQNAFCINPKKNLVTHDGYKINDNPEHYNEKAKLKNNHRNQEIIVSKLKKKIVSYNPKYDSDHFELIKKIDPHFDYLKLRKWLFRLYFRKSFFKMKFKSVKIRI